MAAFTAISRRAVFLDKDGTLLHDLPYNVDPARVSVREGAFAALRRIQGAGYRLFVVSNQPGIALGTFTRSELRTLETYLVDAFRKEGVCLDGFYACPHAADAAPACRCRKPRPGLLLRAAREHRISLDGSWMVGDILDDVEAGNRVGCRTVLLDVGSETVWRQAAARRPDQVATSWPEVADTLLSGDPL